MKYSNILKNSIYCFGMCSNSIKYVDNIKIDTENKTVQNVIQNQDVIQDKNKEIYLTKLFQSEFPEYEHIPKSIKYFYYIGDTNRGKPLSFWQRFNGNLFLCFFSNFCYFFLYLKKTKESFKDKKGLIIQRLQRIFSILYLFFTSISLFISLLYIVSSISNIPFFSFFKNKFFKSIVFFSTVTIIELDSLMNHLYDKIKTKNFFYFLFFSFLNIILIFSFIMYFISKSTFYQTTLHSSSQNVHFVKRNIFSCSYISINIKNIMFFVFYFIFMILDIVFFILLADLIPE
jgi:hypothetical protein